MSEYIVKCKEFVGISGKMKFPEYIDLNQEIVRCRDCKWFYCLTTDACVCERSGEKFMPWVEPDGFCAWGKRKEA